MRPYRASLRIINIDCTCASTERRCCGAGKPGGADEELDSTGLAAAYQMMADHEIQAIRNLNAAATGHNQLLARRVRSGELSPEEGVAQAKAVTPEVNRGRSCAKWHAFSHIQRYKRKKQNVDAKGHKYLSLAHPKMVEFRKMFQTAIDDPKTCGRLVMNIDHVFKFKYRPNNTKLHKDRVHANPNLPRIRMGSKERAGAKIAM